MSKQFSDEQIIEALRKANGIQTDAADLLGCSSETIRLRSIEVPGVRLAIDEGLARIRDRARAVVSGALDSADEKISTDTAKWVLARLDKGTWSERQELTGADGAPMSITMVWPEAENDE